MYLFKYEQIEPNIIVYFVGISSAYIINIYKIRGHPKKYKIYPLFKFMHTITLMCKKFGEQIIIFVIEFIVLHEGAQFTKC